MPEHGVETRPFFGPIHTFPYFPKSEPLPVSELVAQKGICFPSGAGLTDDAIDRSIEAFLRCR